MLPTRPSATVQQSCYFYTSLAYHIRAVGACHKPSGIFTGVLKESSANGFKASMISTLWGFLQPSLLPVGTFSTLAAALDAFSAFLAFLASLAAFFEASFVALAARANSRSSRLRLATTSAPHAVTQALVLSHSNNHLREVPSRWSYLAPRMNDQTPPASSTTQPRITREVLIEYRPFCIGLAPLSGSFRKLPLA